MTRPWKHPKTGVFWLRKGVPAALKGLVGKREVLRSLGTKDAEQAKRLLAAALVELDAQWAKLRAQTPAPVPNEPQPKTLTEREAHERSVWMFRYWLQKHRDNPSEQRFWPTELYIELWRGNSSDFYKLWRLDQEPLKIRLVRDQSVSKAEAWCYEQADDYADLQNWLLDGVSRQRLARALGAAVQRASVILARRAKGDFSPSDWDEVAGASVRSDPSSSPDIAARESVSISAILNDWWSEAKAAGRKPSTYESYRNTISGFVVFLGHDDARGLTAADVVRFKDHRLTTPSPRTGKIPSAKTVKDSDLSALKTIFGWAVSNKRLEANPATGITIKVGKARRLRSKGFTDEEALVILTAASRHLGENESVRTAAAKRWVPWLCAYTGARVGEIAQLRKQDVTTQGDNWIIRITPEAGTVKTNEARSVVLHRAIVDRGFPAFVESAPPGHLFLTPAKTGEVRGPLRGLKNRLAEFSRSIVTDPNVAPNHGWRHRFKTIGMEAGIAPRILDAIQGQAPRSVADSYGDVTNKTIAEAIARLPSIEFKA